MVAFLQKPTGSEEFHQIVDFLASSHIRYALTANPNIYASLIEQFWQTPTVDTVNDREQQLTVTVDGQIIAITEAFVRRHLQLAYAGGISSFPNTEIFNQLTLMRYVSNDDKLTFQKGVHIPLFDTMLIHDQPGQGEAPTLTIESQHTPITSPSISQPTTSQPTSLQEQPSQTKKIYGKALTKLVKKVKQLEDKLKSTTKKRKARMVISDDEKDLGSEDTSKQGRMAETEYEEVEFDLNQERVKTYTRRGRSTDSLRDSTAGGLFSTAEEIQGKERISTDEKVAQKLNKEEMARASTLRYYKKISNTQEETSLSSSSKKEYDDLFKNMAGYKMAYFKGMGYDEIRPIFEEEYRKLQTLFKKDTEVEKIKTKRTAEETLLQESIKKLRTAEASSSEPIQEQLTEEPKELSEEELKKILVKERFRSEEPTEDKERALWVELKRLFELDKDDMLWKLQRYMHDPLTWRLYGTCGVHHVSPTRGHDIYMLTEKDYLLSTAVMNLMLSRRLQVEEDSEISRDLIMKIFIEANKPRSWSGSTSSNTHILDKIDKLERQILNSKLMFVDDDRNPLAHSGGSDRGYGNNSLFGQWRETKRDDDYDPYGDDLYEIHDMSYHLQPICDELDIMVHGRKKK
ncbi:hypothetical protein Tco_0450463 [Tanacetum coccineum]